MSADSLADTEAPSAELAATEAGVSAGTTQVRLAGGLARGASVGRYIVLDVLGEGGMGVVYAAYDPELDRKVAVKLLRRELAGDAATARLLREGRAIARLAHPNVVAVYDVGRHGESGFVAMELVDGTGLDRWLETPRAWREVVARFLQAGEGLIAAHAAGMIHRDFKPANVLVGADGRVRVTDFGLARLGRGDEPPTEAPSASNPDARLTHTGAIMGTPAYMAAEQFDAGEIDERTDQFSFAVALYEGLYGERPFAGKTAAEIATALRANEVRAVPRASAVPSWLRAVVLRGLRANRDERYPTLANMLAALRDDPAIRRRRLVRVGGGIALAGAIALLAFASRGRTANPCDDAGGAIDGVWTSEQRANMTRAFGAVDGQYAVGALASATHALDDYATSWRAMSRDVCEAAHVRHEQSDEQQALRTACLDQRLVDVHALVSLLSGADSEVVRNAVRAAASLRPVSDCADLAALTSAPTDPATLSRVSLVREQLATARALGAAGKYRDALAQATRIAADAEAVGYKPLVGEALLLEGEMTGAAGDPNQAEVVLARAIQSAEAGRDDWTKALAWIELVRAVSAQSHREHGLVDAAYAAATIERLGGDPLLEASLDGYRSRLLVSTGKYEDGRAAAARALATRRKLLPANSLDIATSLIDLGDALLLLASYDDAKAAYDEALAIRERALGKDHPEVASALAARGKAQLEKGDLKGAEASLRQALAIREQVLGANHPAVAEVLADLGVALRTAGRYDEAVEVYQRSLAVTERSLGRQHPTYAKALHNLGAVYMLMNRLTDAERTLDDGIAVVIATGGPDHPDLAAFYSTLVTTYANEQRWADAYAANAHATAIDIKALGPNHPHVAIDIEQLGETYQRQGKLADAEKAYRMSLAIDERALGKDHPHLAIELSNLAGVVSQQGHYAEALELLQRALALDEKELGPKAPDLIFDLVGLGEAEQQLGHHREAIAYLERAIALDAKRFHPSSDANARFWLGWALWDAGDDRARARTLMSEAAQDPNSKQAAEVWLRSHR